MLLFAALVGCDMSGACVDLPVTCAPQYTPTFDGEWTNTLAPSCALSGCHADGAGGLDMGSTFETAYAALVDGGYVIPGDPSCSSVVTRIEPAGLSGMPPGLVLAPEERCAVATWIAEGALP